MATEDPSGLPAPPEGRPPPSPPTPAPSPFGIREGRMIVLFDVLWSLGAVLVWGPPLVLAGSIPLALAAHPLWALFSLPAAYLVFLTALVLWLGVVGALLPREEPGTSRVFVDRAFFAFLLRWGLEKYAPRPLITHIQLLTVLRTLHYRLQGMSLSWSSHISPGALVNGPALVKLGHLTYLGEYAHISSHISQGDKLVLAPVVLGDRTNIGAHCHISPGCTLGADVRVGALCDLAPGVVVGDFVELGPACQVGMGVSIGAGSKIEPRAFLPSWTAVPEGEVWGGDPATRVGEVRLTRGELRRRARRRDGRLGSGAGDAA